MPLKRCGIGERALERVVLAVSASWNRSRVASSGSMPPGSSARSAVLAATSCIDARFFELASVNNSGAVLEGERRKMSFRAHALLLIRRAPAQAARESSDAARGRHRPQTRARCACRSGA
jgi:hypothetical protein